MKTEDITSEAQSFLG